MKVDRLQVDLDTPTIDISNRDVDTIHIDVQHCEPQFINTYGGEYSSSCECCGDIDISYYGIQMDDITIELSAKTALELCRKLKEHLETNGHKI